jgi:hypothetical protein
VEGEKEWRHVLVLRSTISELCPCLNSNVQCSGLHTACDGVLYCKSVQIPCCLAVSI